jgi:hypothetical protein
VVFLSSLLVADAILSSLFIASGTPAFARVLSNKQPAQSDALQTFLLITFSSRLFNLILLWLLRDKVVGFTYDFLIFAKTWEIGVTVYALCGQYWLRKSHDDSDI